MYKMQPFQKRFLRFRSVQSFPEWLFFCLKAREPIWEGELFHWNSNFRHKTPRKIRLSFYKMVHHDLPAGIRSVLDSDFPVCSTLDSNSVSLSSVSGSESRGSVRLQMYLHGT